MRHSLVLPLIAFIAFIATLSLFVVAVGCGSPTATRSFALTASRVVYYHQTFAAGPDLTSTSAGLLDEDRRSEPFGAAIDAFRDGAVLPVDYRGDPINALNKFSDPDTQWSYHGARWLAPDTAQWHTPDPPATAPDPAFMAQPWALHPYQYVEQNPIAYWDPDGNCSAPILAPGEVGICIEAYIGAARVGFLGLGAGDDRGPAGNDASQSNRLEQQIKVTLSTFDLANSTHLARSGGSTLAVALGGAITSLGAAIGLQGTGDTNVRDQTIDPAHSTTTFTAGGHGANGAQRMPLIGGLLAPGGSIDYAFTFQVDGKGDVTLVNGAHKAFPSYGVYAYRRDANGATITTTLRETTEHEISDLKVDFDGRTDKPINQRGIEVYHDD
jgi:RHS repeat-associated protein